MKTQRSRIYRTRAAIAMMALAAATISVGATAHADTASGPPSLPDEGMTDDIGSPLACYAPQLVDFEQYNPQVQTDSDGNTEVLGVGAVDTTNGCSGDQVNFVLQVKDCPWWRPCSWDDLDSVTYVGLPANGELVSRHLTGPLSSGTNRYRVIAYVTTLVLDADDEPEPGFAGLVPEIETDIGNGGAQLSS